MTTGWGRLNFDSYFFVDFSIFAIRLWCSADGGMDGLSLSLSIVFLFLVSFIGFNYS